MNKVTYLILHNVRSAQNVGSIFRTADACGVSKIYLTGYTPTPLDRFNRPVKEIAKTALGAEKNINWEKLTINKCLENLRNEGFYIIALEQNKKSVDYKKIKPKSKTAILVGNEVLGVSEAVLSQVDMIGEIPMKGKKESLNVSVALGVALFRIMDL
jgi:tRNA G18 (ribose-2'-O)-methylase SpoU